MLDSSRPTSSSGKSTLTFGKPVVRSKETETVKLVSRLKRRVGVSVRRTTGRSVPSSGSSWTLLSLM
eukprot:scaffold240524_cov18-Prasinocladus_malaysianus.AAC.1